MTKFALLLILSQSTTHQGLQQRIADGYDSLSTCQVAAQHAQLNLPLGAYFCVPSSIPLDPDDEAKR
jgi:hypothetical protein